MKKVKIYIEKDIDLDKKIMDICSLLTKGSSR